MSITIEKEVHFVCIVSIQDKLPIKLRFSTLAGADSLVKVLRVLEDTTAVTMRDYERAIRLAHTIIVTLEESGAIRDREHSPYPDASLSKGERSILNKIAHVVPQGHADSLAKQGGKHVQER